jgi:hypothetical protein
MLVWNLFPKHYLNAKGSNSFLVMLPTKQFLQGEMAEWSKAHAC